MPANRANHREEGQHVNSRLRAASVSLARRPFFQRDAGSTSPKSLRAIVPQWKPRHREVRTILELAPVQA
jgi:hypothetical protein